MELTARRIEIFAPFSGALDLTKRILFQPFDLGKWCVIGFAAFLANLGGGGGNGFNIPSKLGKGDWNVRSTAHDALGGVDTMPAWLIPLIVGVGLFVIALLVVMMWLGARGKFIFTDCVVRNRGAIVEPWKEYKREGNSLFLFRLAVFVAFVVLLALAALPLWMPLALHGRSPEGAALVVGVVLVACVGLIGGLAVGMVTYFMVPIMYRRRCGAVQAVKESAGLIMSEPGPIILFFLFNVVLAVAIAFAACLLTCVTCCVTAIPYVGTVILLPLFVFWAGYLLLFIRQFGPEYDVWSGLAPAAPVAPPVQEPPPPTEPPPLA